MDTTTARIDLGRLQLLNDRICQTLEAINQLRLTAHAYAPAYGQGYAQSFVGAPTVGMDLGWNRFNTFGLGNTISGYNGINPINTFGLGTIPAYNHFVSPYGMGINPMVSPFSYGVNPFTTVNSFGVPNHMSATVSPVVGRGLGVDARIGQPVAW